MSSNVSIIVVIPLFNEQENIHRIAAQVQTLPYQVVFVDDGSTDGTYEELPRADHITVVRHGVNRGVGAATQTGIDVALGLGADVVVTMDGDGQHDPEDIARLVAALQEQQVDVVIGSRFIQKNNIPVLRRFYNFMGNIITYLLSGLYVTDSQSGFKAFTAKAAHAIEIHANGYAFCSEVIREMSWFNLSFVEVPVSVKYFKDDMGKGQSFAKGIETVFKLIVRSLMR